MANRKFLKMGRFGWTLISTVTVVLVASALFFFNLFDLNPLALFGGDDSNATEADDMSEETAQQVEEVRETVGEENQDLGQFVSDTHDFYNETTGYGGISSLDWDRQREEANLILNTLEDKLPEVEDNVLQADLERIRELANGVINEKESGHVRTLHRMFHDLDIAMNDYNTYDKIWNAT
ncbi:hypothetical protein [Lentibacillus sp. CBA3610]|uniref:hypothetical protein n=1 Tax=Lentibacillus sp. CBA3610 TaxID=2518176 RepID=UPI001595AB75|nr:hypothetical protein [Lentibacillus sp. CBA3610]QKY68343.1 hypothetical protein Len3610_00750 [Lentibacillus sp. CBA3610]